MEQKNWDPMGGLCSLMEMHQQLGHSAHSFYTGNQGFRFAE